MCFFAQTAEGLASIADAIQDTHFMTQVPQRAMLTPADPGAARRPTCCSHDPTRGDL